MKAQYTANQTDTLDAYISRNNSLLTLKKLMSMDADANLDIVYPDTHGHGRTGTAAPSQDDEVNKALQTMPELKLDQKAIDIARQAQR